MALNITERISPNRSSGRSARVDRLIYHHTGGGFDGALNWTMNPASRVSYHYMVNRAGRIWRTVHERDTAWHAAATNARSVAICGETNGWTDAARDSFVALTREICGRWGMPINRTTIRRHGEVMQTACPGSLPIDEWVRLAAQPPGPPPPPAPPPARFQGGTELIVQHPLDSNRLDFFHVGADNNVSHRWTTDGSGMHAFWEGQGNVQSLGGPVAAGTLAATWNREGTWMNLVGVSPTDREGAPEGCGALLGMLLPIRAEDGEGQWRRLRDQWGMLP